MEEQTPSRHVWGCCVGTRIPTAQEFADRDTLVRERLTHVVVEAITSLSHISVDRVAVPLAIGGPVAHEWIVSKLVGAGYVVDVSTIRNIPPYITIFRPKKVT